MPYTVNRFSTVDLVLNAAVANSGTVTFAYPAGTSQLDFNIGLAALSGSYVILDNNDKYTVAASQVTLAFGASLITLTNSTGATWPINTKIKVMLDQQDGNDTVTFAFNVKLAKVTAADIVTDFRPGVYGFIEHVQFLVTDPVTTAAKLATVTPKIDGVSVTGGVLALTSAGLTPLGIVVPSTLPTAANTLTPASKLSLTASAVTAFVEGEGMIYVRIRKNPAQSGT